MKKTNIILIGILVFSIFPIFYANAAIAAYGSKYIYPDGDYQTPQWGPRDGEGHWWRVAEQTEEEYIFSFISPCLDKYTLSNPGLSSQYIPQVKMMVYASIVIGSIPDNTKLDMYMRIDGVTYKKTVTVQGDYTWYEFSLSCPSGYWTAADINGMRCRVQSYWYFGEILLSRIKIKVYWTTTPP
ncbi:MAG: hypothetical protein ACFFCI_20485 [Promethearchaeota archaeon]